MNIWIQLVCMCACMRVCGVEWCPYLLVACREEGFCPVVSLYFGAPSTSNLSRNFLRVFSDWARLFLPPWCVFFPLGAHLASSQEYINLLRLYFFSKQMGGNFLQFHLQQVITYRPITHVKIFTLLKKWRVYSNNC